MDVSFEDKNLLAAVAKALSVWTWVEFQLGLLFHVLAELKDSNRARAIFDGIISFEVRLSILDRLMALEKVDETEAEMWNRLSAKLSKFYKKRHELAHFGLGFRNELPCITPFMTFEKMLKDTQIFLSSNE